MRASIAHLPPDYRPEFLSKAANVLGICIKRFFILRRWESELGPLFREPGMLYDSAKLIGQNVELLEKVITDG